MKAPIGILLVFTGLTLGYLVITGKLPMTTTAGTITNNPSFVPGQGNTIKTQPTPSAQCYGLSGTALQLCLKNAGMGGGLVASVPDTYISGYIKAGRYAL